MNIYEKIQEVKSQLLKANLKKGGVNKFSNFTYYELTDILPTIIELCKEVKLFTAVTFTEEFAILRIINSEKTDEVVEYSSPMRQLELKGCNQIQALGGVETYSRRYLYMCAFDITENDMFDGNKDNTETKEETETKLITKQNVTVLQSLIKGLPEAKAFYDNILATYSIKDLAELNSKQYAEILVEIKKVKGV